MDERHPKRRKDKNNPYTLSMASGRFYLSFRDGMGVPHEMEIDGNLYELLNAFELEDLSYPFPNRSSSTEYDDTMQNRSCGIMSFSMVAATYLHHEIEPTVLADYAVDSGYRVEAHGVQDTFFHTAAAYYGIPDPTITYAEDGIDWDEIIRKITEENAMVIVHEYTGPFTSRQHYMVLEDYEVIDGRGYFLVADPYVLRSRYSGWDRLLDPNRGNDGLIYATPGIIAETCSAVTVFDRDKTAWDMTARAAAPEAIPLRQTLEDAP